MICGVSARCCNYGIWQQVWQYQICSSIRYHQQQLKGRCPIRLICSQSADDLCMMRPVHGGPWHHGHAERVTVTARATARSRMRTRWQHPGLKSRCIAFWASFFVLIFSSSSPRTTPSNTLLLNMLYLGSWVMCSVVINWCVYEATTQWITATQK